MPQENGLSKPILKEIGWKYSIGKRRDGWGEKNIKSEMLEAL